MVCHLELLGSSKYREIMLLLLDHCIYIQTNQWWLETTLLVVISGLLLKSFDRLVHYLIYARLIQGILWNVTWIITRSVPSSPTKSYNNRLVFLWNKISRSYAPVYINENEETDKFEELREDLSQALDMVARETTESDRNVMFRSFSGKVKVATNINETVTTVWNFT